MAKEDGDQMHSNEKLLYVKQNFYINLMAATHKKPQN